MSVTYECCVLSRNGPIPGPEESYQMRACVCVCVCVCVSLIVISSL
jgi:hypothetical protein